MPLAEKIEFLCEDGLSISDSLKGKNTFSISKPFYFLREEAEKLAAASSADRDQRPQTCRILIYGKAEGKPEYERLTRGFSGFFAVDFKSLKELRLEEERKPSAPIPVSAKLMLSQKDNEGIPFSKLSYRKDIPLRLDSSVLIEGASGFKRDFAKGAARRQSLPRHALLCGMPFGRRPCEGQDSRG